MPVNTASLKTFAPAMRRQLLEAVGRKLDLLLHSQTPDTLSTYARQIAELREQESDNRDQLLERVAYTWFNRLCALRYLDARGWHPFGCKVLMPAGEDETQPELLKLMRAGSLPAELKSHTNEARLHELLDGQIPPAVAGADPQGEVYRELVLASCRSYHKLLPDLFEGLDDASELLLPDDLLSEGSIAGGFRIAISDTDCEDVEIIGWLYQFYISEKKDQVIGKVVKSEDIPAATQLFTPNWIVKYMVQNSLGATWLATYPDSPLKGTMEFYIKPAQQTPEVQAQLTAITPDSLDPEKLTLIDPACGSGHILVEAYNLLKAIYLERGYRQRDIPELILTRNIFGLDICPRAVQLATFALLMKGREDDRRLLERGIILNMMALQDSQDINVERLAENIDLSGTSLSREDLRMIIELFAHATIFGSLIQVPAFLVDKLPALTRIEELSSLDLFSSSELQRILALARQATILSRRYDAVVANPPYIGSKYHTSILKKFLKDHFSGYEKDVFSAFIDRCISLSKCNGRLGFMSPFVWMFISSHEHLRTRLIDGESITTLVQLEYSGFDGATVPVCTFTLRKGHVKGEKGCFVRLSDFRGSVNQAPKTLEAIQNRHCGWFYEVAQDDFKKIPGSPVAYWLGRATFLAFDNNEPLRAYAEARIGMATGRNDHYVRLWGEVCYSSLKLNSSSRADAVESQCKWFPYAKGGEFRRWYGNHTSVVNWKDDGRELQTTLHPDGTRVWAHNFNLDEIFKESLSWTFVTSGSASFRIQGAGFLFDSASGLCQPKESVDISEILAYLNSKIPMYWLPAINPTLNLPPGSILALPFRRPRSRPGMSEAIAIARDDWDAYERSWDFLITHKPPRP
jgi:hypothetical protein